MRTRILLSRVIWALACYVSSSIAEAGVAKLRLNGLDMGIDKDTGGLVYLASADTGVILQAAPESAGLLDVAYPTDSYVPLRLSSRYSKARVEQEANGLTITWNPLGPNRANAALPSGKVVARVTLRAADDGRSVILTCRLENHSDIAIPQILFPDLHGLQPFDGLESTQLRLAGGVVQPFPMPWPDPDSAVVYKERGWKEYPASSYGGLNALRWLDYGSLKAGLSVFEKKWGGADAPDILTIRSEADPLSLRLMWQHKATVMPGQIWDSAEFWLTPHRGGWAKGIEVYRKYVQQVNPSRDLPRHVRDGVGFQSIWMLQSLDRDPSQASFRFADLPRVAEDARAHGITEVVLWGWCQYLKLPIPCREELGSEEEFLQGIRRAKEMGVNMVPFVSVQSTLPAQAKRYRTTPEGDYTYHGDLIPPSNPYYAKTYEMYLVDGGDLAWQQDVLNALTKWVELGVASFSWDQFLNEAQQRKAPALIDLVGKIRSLARARDAESTFSGESACLGSLEQDGAVLDYFWNWVDYADAGPVLNVLRAPRLNCNVENSPLVVKKGFMDGLYLNLLPKKPDWPNGSALIGERPALSAAVKEVASLRRQFLPFFVEGTFLGDSILSQPTRAFVRGHQLGDRLLVLVLNDQKETQDLVFQTDLSLWLPRTEAYEVKSYDSKGTLLATTAEGGARWLGIARQLQPLELAIFEIQAR